MSMGWRAIRSRGASWCCRTGLSLRKRARSVCSPVRAVLVADPVGATSAKSAAYSSLSRGSGPSVANSSGDPTTGGSVNPSHGACISPLPVGTHIPGGGSAGRSRVMGASRPSSARAATSAAAAS